ncbi:MAG: imidazole glycerol phosphate synthase subunit HisH [Chloroflexi bacterium]|nr:imidazole glycerol phosphate synthase subunit HisH [Chloroflexota bacterium]
MRIALIDYGIGNLRSVQKAFEHVGAQVTLTDDPQLILNAEKVVLPGVGAFGDGMKGLRVRGLDAVVKEVVRVGKPLLGICVGMQVLFESSEELGEHEGLGILPGQVLKFPVRSDDFSRPSQRATEAATTSAKLKVPHTGWNQIEPQKDNPLFRGLPIGSFAYFNHSYCCTARPEDTLAVTDYGGAYPSIVGCGRVYGIQFHPEKSQSVGLTLLRNFVEQG